MNRSQLEHIIRAASRISGDTEIIVIGSQAIHAQTERLPPIVFQSMEAYVYPRNHPERADEIDGAISELSDFHQTFGYYRRLAADGNSSGWLAAPAYPVEQPEHRGRDWALPRRARSRLVEIRRWA